MLITITVVLWLWLDPITMLQQVRLLSKGSEQNSLWSSVQGIATGMLMGAGIGMMAGGMARRRNQTQVKEGRIIVRVPHDFHFPFAHSAAGLPTLSRHAGSQPDQGRRAHVHDPASFSAHPR